jgi:serine kinase of HPr protein (carbohydrate metabolism regulator)
MTLQEIITKLNLTVLTEEKDFEQIVPSSGYTSDLLSCVMAGAQHKAIWITLQAHTNIVAVAALLDLSAIIITEGAQPEEDVIAKANEENITLLLTNQFSYEMVGQLWEMGLKNF